MYKLWIDDQAYDDDVEAWRRPPTNDWKVATTSTEAIEIVKSFGIPGQIEFDHDLGLAPDGKPDTAMTFLKWLASEYPDGIRQIHYYNIHSRNPNGAANIHSFLESWRKVSFETKE